MLKKLLSAIKISALALVLSFGLSFVFAWTAPAELPPDGNTDAPINIGDGDQIKAGGLTVGSLATAGLTPTANTVTAGAFTTTGLTRTGTLRVTSGAAAGRVLTSDATGNATWQVGGGAGDNLGNHIATTTLNMSGYGISNVGGITAAGEVDVTGGTGTSYTTAPIEVRTTATPRLAFHWPGVVASQIGMDSAGTIRTYDNPGTGYANFAAAGITAVGNGSATFGPNSSWGALLNIGGNGRTTTNASVVATNGNLHLDARNGGYGTYLNWYSSGTTGVHVGNGAGGYGLLYASDVSGGGKLLSQAWTGNFEIINAAAATTYTRSHVGKVMIVYQGNGFQGGNGGLGWSYYFNGALVDSWSGVVNYQVMTNHTWYHSAVVNGNFTVRLDTVINMGHNQIIIYYL